MGGMNTWTPVRSFVPTTVNTPLLSDDVSDIRRHYGLNCSGGRFQVESMYCNVYIVTILILLSVNLFASRLLSLYTEFVELYVCVCVCVYIYNKIKQKKIK